jgi:protein-tyrosine phosphatase
MTIIDQTLAVGRFVDAELMHKEGWKVLCVASGEIPLPEGSLHLPMVDGSGSSEETIAKAILFIVEQWKSNNKVFVCCKHGQNRSVLVSAAALAVSGRFEWFSMGLRYIYDKRQVARGRDDTMIEVLRVVTKLRPVAPSHQG